MSDALKRKFAANSIERYRHGVATYRQADASEHRSVTFFRDRIASLSASLPGATVLDLGCGTGRYFHVLGDAARIVGVDVSPEMLHVAETDPVFGERIGTRPDLICSDVHTVAFSDQSFDFIYSIGLFGHHSPFTAEMCGKVARWLKPEGRALLYVMDASTPREPGWKRDLALMVRPCLPRFLQDRITVRLRDYRIHQAPLQALLDNCGFDSTIVRTRDVDPGGEVWSRLFFLCELSHRSGGVQVT